MGIKILLINGPNLNLLGTREPDVYGKIDLNKVESQLKTTAQNKGYELTCHQSNHEGSIIDFIHENKLADYLIINPGGLTHTSVSLRDALSAVKIPFIEVHISNTHAREEFRHRSYLSGLASGIIIGCGIEGYGLALDLIIRRLS
ncbi:MAG: type II 3-dehydroquinate dehydratase [Deltaproteobacteria bacterium]|nr:type II 3-dehydroquinate dehydratase [Deltaproteobacteria bacterium]